MSSYEYDESDIETSESNSSSSEIIDNFEIDENIEKIQEEIYEHLNNSEEINIRDSLNYILKKKDIEIMYEKENKLNIKDKELLNHLYYKIGKENIYTLLLSIVSLFCIGITTGNNYNSELSFYVDLYNKSLKGKKIKNDLFWYEKIDENNESYYDLIFKLDKSQRKKILCKDIEQEFKERKRQRKLEKIRYEASLNIYKRKVKYNCNIEIKKIKQKSKKFIDEIDSFIKEYDDYYNNNLIVCKEKTCNIKCGNDVGFCLKHLPKHCENCNYICNSNDKFDKLHSNKKNGIENYCNSCAQETYFKNFINEYNYKDIIHVIDENDKFYKTKLSLAKQTFLDMEKDAEILHGINNPEDLQEKEILEFYGYKTDDYNEFTKYKLYNRITRSNELLKEFNDKLLYLKVKPSFYSYISKIQFMAFKKFLHKLLNIDDYTNILKINNIVF